MTIENERVRIQAILGSDAGQRLPKLAEALAFTTDLEPEAAAGILAAAVADKEAATASKPGTPSIDPNRARQPGAAGIGMPDSTERDTTAGAKNNWGKAVAHANRGVESLLVAGGLSAASVGWSKAVVNASRGVA